MRLGALHFVLKARWRTYIVVSLYINKQAEGNVFSGSPHDAYRDASEAFRAKRKAWREGEEGAPIIGRLYGTKGKVLEEFSEADAQWKQLDGWCDDQLHIQETQGSGLVPQAGEEKYKPLSEASSQG